MINDRFVNFRAIRKIIERFYDLELPLDQNLSSQFLGFLDILCKGNPLDEELTCSVEGHFGLDCLGLSTPLVVKS